MFVETHPVKPPRDISPPVAGYTFSRVDLEAAAGCVPLFYDCDDTQVQSLPHHYARAALPPFQPRPSLTAPNGLHSIRPSRHARGRLGTPLLTCGR